MKKIKSFLEKKNLGMTYVELIVVLSIMSIMSAVVLFNYQDFQAKVDMKNLSSEIGQKLVQAQKFAMSGEDVPFLKQGSKSDNWRPSYGLFFSTSFADYKKQFAYFADLNQSLNILNKTPAYTYGGNPFDCTFNLECLDIVKMNKDYSISSLKVGFSNGCEVVGVNSGTGVTTGDCVSGKQKIANDYELNYEPTDGYFYDNYKNQINPNAGLYMYNDLFVELNSGTKYTSNDFDIIYVDMSPVVEEKKKIAFKYKLDFNPEDGFFYGSEGQINPNVGYYIFKNDFFIDLNTGYEYTREDLSKNITNNGKFYEISKLVGVDVDTGHYVDLPSAEEIFIPSKTPTSYSSDKIELYKYPYENTGVYPKTGLFVDLTTLGQKYIPRQSPIICQDNTGTGSTVRGTDKTTVYVVPINDLSITFIRPDSRAIIQFASDIDTGSCVPSSAEVEFGSSGSAKSKILIYPSGRVQIK